MVQITRLYGVKTAKRGVLWTETAQLSFHPRYFSYSQLRPCHVVSTNEALANVPRRGHFQSLIALHANTVQHVVQFWAQLEQNMAK
jgi:hypothetical protein